MFHASRGGSERMDASLILRAKFNGIADSRETWILIDIIIIKYINILTTNFTNCTIIL